MPLFEYAALDPRGRRRRGLLDAASLQSARDRLRREGLFVVSLEAAEAERHVAEGGGVSLRRVTRAELAALTRQLATLLKAGLPLVQALEALMEQAERPSTRKVLGGIRNRVNEGAAFHEALAEFPAVFPPTYVQMCRAGEAGGFIDRIMLRLAESLEREARLRGRVTAALVYPVLMVVLGFVFLVLLFAFVIPQVVGIFADFGRTLPLPTRALLTVSGLVSRYWVLLAAAAAGVLFLYHRMGASARFGTSVDAFRLRVPLLGRLRLKLATARMCSTLGSLLQGGVPLVRALEVAADVLGNRVLASALRACAQAVSRGGAFADALRAQAAFPPMVTRVVAVGEQSGDLAGMLSGVAESYEEEVNLSLQGLMSILEPVLILAMAAVVLFVVLAVLLPIFELNQLVRSG